MQSTPSGNESELILSDSPIACVIVLDEIPPSLKNSRRNISAISRSGKRYTKTIPSQAAVAYTKRLQAAVRDALIDLPVAEGDSLWGHQNISLSVVIDEKNRRSLIEVRLLGGREGPRKRDVQNTIEAPCDALEGLLYDNDRQMRWVEARYGEIGHMTGVEWIYAD